MKNYINLISDEELRSLCGWISAKALRDIYQKNGNSFSKLKRGFRPGSLNDEETYNFACANKNIPFVADFLNFVIDKWLNEISEAKETAVKDGMTETIAFIETLANSVFYDNPALYFKITETELPTENEELFFHAIKLAVERNRMSEDDYKNTYLDNNSDSSKHPYETEVEVKQLDYEESLNASKQEIESLKSVNEQLKVKLEGSEANLIVLEKELKTYRELSAHVIDEEEIKPTQGYHYASICVTYMDDFGRDRLLRVADVKDGMFSESLIESAPEYYKLYRHDGPYKEGSIGVWDWRVIPNKSDPTKDYIESSYNENIKPIEVISFKDCKSIGDLIEILKQGVSAELHTDRVVFCIPGSGKYEGVYCESNELESRSGLIELKEEVLKLPVYTFYRIDTLVLDNAIILNKTNMGLPQRLVRVKDPMEIVRNCIISKATWPVSQQKGFVRSEYQQIRAFLTELQTDELYEEISKKCDCSLSEAAEYVSAFMNRADKVIAGDTVENKAMVQIIKNDPEVYAACMSELRNVWEDENESLIIEANEEIDKLKQEESKTKETIDKEKEELISIQNKIEEGKNEIDSQIAMAEKVEQLVAEKIEQARNNAASFIAENAFMQAVNPPIVTDRSFETKALDQKPSLFREHSAIDSDDPDVNKTYNELLQTVRYELLEAGVAEGFTTGLAALLYSAYIRRVPILLAGPNGHDIADAFSVSINCHTAAVIDCIGNNFTDLTKCESSEEPIVVIENPLQAGWENNVIKLISNRNRFYVLTQPFSDDLLVEPRGLYNYCVPVLTELFVDASPGRNYTGGKLSADFKHYLPENDSKLYGKILDELNITSLVRENIQALISDFAELADVANPDFVLQLLLYPLAYAIGESQVLIDKIDVLDQKPTSHTISKLKRLIGEEE